MAEELTRGSNLKAVSQLFNFFFFLVETAMTQTFVQQQ